MSYVKLKGTRVTPVTILGLSDNLLGLWREKLGVNKQG
jgi:hypothetical protein